MRKSLSIAALILMITGFSTVHAQSQWTKLKEELVFKNPPFKQCHASLLVEVSASKLLLSCFGGSSEGKQDVDIWLCTLSDDGISTPRDVANGMVNDTLRYPTWNPVLFKTKTDKLILFYKVSPDPREWIGMVKTSNDSGII